MNELQNALRNILHFKYNDSLLFGRHESELLVPHTLNRIENLKYS